MVICGECGTQNSDTADFCTNCGAYLAWDGDPATKQAGPDPVRQLQRADASVADSNTGADGAIRPRADSPRAVKPGERVFVPAPAAPSPADKPAPGELICGNCGTGNEAHRKFCRRCAASLADAVVEPQPSWFRRVIRPRRRKVAIAGARPPHTQRRFPTRTAIFVVALVIIAGAAYLSREAIGATIGMLQDELGDSAVHPASVTATSETPGRLATLTDDGLSDTSWAPAVGDSVGSHLEAAFAEPIRLVYVTVSPGASTVQADFLAEGRPARVNLIAVDSAGAESRRQVELKDEASAQRFYIGIDDVMILRLELLSSNGPPSAPVAIAEVEYSARR